LNPGTTGLVITGVTSHTKAPTQQVGDYGPYTSQWTVLTDPSDSIGIWLNDSRPVNDGEEITVKGKLKSYVDKAGETKFSLGGKIDIPAPPSGQAAPQQAQQAAQQPPQGRQDVAATVNAQKALERRSIEKQVCIKAACLVFERTGQAGAEMVLPLVRELDAWIQGQLGNVSTNASNPTEQPNDIPF